MAITRPPPSYPDFQFIFFSPKVPNFFTESIISPIRPRPNKNGHIPAVIPWRSGLMSRKLIGTYLSCISEYKTNINDLNFLNNHLRYFEETHLWRSEGHRKVLIERYGSFEAGGGLSVGMLDYETLVGVNRGLECAIKLANSIAEIFKEEYENIIRNQEWMVHEISTSKKLDPDKVNKEVENFLRFCVEQSVGKTLLESVMKEHQNLYHEFHTLKLEEYKRTVAESGLNSLQEVC